MSEADALCRQHVDEAVGGIINLFGCFWAASICVACHLLPGDCYWSGAMRQRRGPTPDITINIRRPVDPDEKAQWIPSE